MNSSYLILVIKNSTDYLQLLSLSKNAAVESLLLQIKAQVNGKCK